MRRIERLINLIAALLDTRRPLTADEIRTSIAGYESPTKEAFRRSFERDKKDLRDMGIPIETVRLGPFEDEGDGYIIPKDKYYMPELDLEPDELAALRLVADTAMVAGDQAQAGVQKLSIFSPGESEAGPRIAVRANVTAEEPLLPAAFSAVQGRTPVAFRYVDSEGVATYRRVEPYSLTHQRGHWYLVGRDVDRSDVRSFRLERVASALEVVPGTYDVPEGFDALAKTGVEPWELGGETRTATLRFDAGMRWWAEQHLAGDEETEGPEGALEVAVPYSNVEGLLALVIGFAGAVEIVSPSDARAALLDHLAPYLEARS